MLLSVIVPLYNEEEIVEKTFSVLEEELKNIEHEIIFVNDGSKDKTREILEKALIDFNGTILFISHDRYFINKVANSIAVLKDKKIQRYLGNYDDYIVYKNK